MIVAHLFAGSSWWPQRLENHFAVAGHIKKKKKNLRSSIGGVAYVTVCNASATNWAATFRFPG